MDRRPTTFKHWRALWWESSRQVGMDVCYQMSHGGRVVMYRELWKEIQRCLRLYNRVLIEVEVKDESFMNCMAESLLREIRTRQEPER